MVPLDDVWQLRQESLVMGHCVDKYIGDCQANQVRLFSVRNVHGKRVATLGLRKWGKVRWSAFNIRGFANRAASAQLAQLKHEVAVRYNLLWQASDGTLARPEQRLPETSPIAGQSGAVDIAELALQLLGTRNPT